ncbi:MAG TPA: serine/threonine-protein kinase [Gemmatimonas sp.]|nr:serine/threonine-protein kinase [Gemmatimonas sp.]
MPDRYLGRQIGKYRVIRLLGVGAFAWVYEAIDRDLEIPVALKILRPEFAGQEAAEARFRREAATAARLRHPNIVTVRDVGQSDGASFVAMDLLPLSLARRLELVTRLPEPEVVRLGLDIAAALAIAHAGGIIHRDIKPDNILIGSAGEAVVADFGLARALSSDASLSATNQVMGTPHYFSPEQARGQDLDGRSDLYSLGVTLFRAVTGHLPFEGDDWYAVARQHVEAPPPPPSEYVPDISPAFEATLLRLLAKNPDERFNTAIQLADSLATLPTAPLDRGSMLTPHSSSQTVIDLTPVVPLPVVESPVWKRTARAVALAGLLVASVWAVDSRTGMIARAFGGTADAGSVALDSTRGDSIRALAAQSPTGSDSGGGVTINMSTPSVTPIPTAAEAARLARATPAAKATLTVMAAENAAIYVNGERVGEAHWSGERTAPSVVRLRAVIVDASIDCGTASRDTSVQVARGSEYTVRIPVRSCVGLILDVNPPEALVIFKPLDGGDSLKTRASDNKATTVATGWHVISASHPRCTSYGPDTVDIRRRQDGSPFRLRVRMQCGRELPTR